jgi:hypothetical protein
MQMLTTLVVFLQKDRVVCYTKIVLLLSHRLIKLFAFPQTDRQTKLFAFPQTDQVVYVPTDRQSYLRPFYNSRKKFSLKKRGGLTQSRTVPGLAAALAPTPAGNGTPPTADTEVSSRSTEDGRKNSDTT